MFGKKHESKIDALVNFDTVACMKVIFELSFQFLEGKKTYYLTISAKFLTRIEK